jgi:hypothetical protein
MKRWVVMAACAAAACSAGTAALAHGEAKARHGGVVQMASDIAFELAQTPEGAVLFLEDHGQPMPTQGAFGKLIVLKGSERTDAELVAGGDNRLVAQGITLASGAKAVALVTLTGKKSVTVRFQLK